LTETTTITLRQQGDYQFVIDFGADLAPLLADEPPPLGQGAGPKPDHLLLAGVANCLAASLFFALRKYKQEPGGISATATATVDRNAANRLRIQAIQVDLTLGAQGEGLAHLERALAQFEDFCTVSQSVQSGIPVAVTVSDGSGRRLK
jgi:uncharacterized OsmC-like protein